MAPKPDTLGIKGVDHFDFVVHDLERSRRFYADKMDFLLVGRSKRGSEENEGERALVFSAGKINIRCTEPVEKTSPAGRYMRHHPDGIRTVAFRVADLDAAWKFLDERGANFLDEPFRSDGYGSFQIATPLGDVAYEFVERAEGKLDPRLAAVVGENGGNQHQFTHVDHITSNTREMKALTNWYRDVLGFEHFWDIRFHTRDSNPDSVGSGLRSIVMWDPNSNVKLATNEPLRPNFQNSQIQKFVADNGGPGVQHLALGTRAIMDTIPAMRDAGLTFLETPDAYYEMLPQRMAERAVENLKEDIEELRRRRILVDGRDNRYLLQIFMQDAALMYSEIEAGPFFYEVIQRHGEQGFGEGNFRALFESIERQQSGETQRTVTNPYIND
jgi:4-hydroxyphenylpyruvate dioxygenase